MRHPMLQRSRARRLTSSLPGHKPRHWPTLRLMVPGLLFLVAACSTSEPSAVPETPATRDAESGVEAPHITAENMSDRKDIPAGPKTNGSANPVPPEIMQQLIDAVAAEAGVNTSDVKLERAEKTTYRDSSLDCPEPNMAYAQVLVNGYWVVFHVGREEFDMRVTERGKFSRCTGSTKRAPIRYDDT